MYQTRPHGDSPVSIIGAGIAGAWHALLLAQAGRAVTVHERSDASMTQSTSHWAGGMLAPWCEAEAHARDRADFERFAKLTANHRRLDAQALSDLEPSLEGRFREGLFYPDEGHVEPRRVLPELHAAIAKFGGRIEFNSGIEADDLDGLVIDCRGIAARDAEPDIRGVKGEM
jgi:glycine oxidase